MTSFPLLPRQRQQLIVNVQQSTNNPIFVIIYDTQSVTEIVETLTGVTISSSEMEKGGVARFRLSNYLPTGEKLVEDLKEAIPTFDWIILHTGCSICPEIILEFFQYLCSQTFSKPRIVVIGEQTDVTFGNENMQELFRLGHVVNLLAGGN